MTCWSSQSLIAHTLRRLEHAAVDRDSRVGSCALFLPYVPEYRRARRTRWEAGGTTSQGYIRSLTDSAQYREGTVKSTPARGVKEILKSFASMQSKPPCWGDGVPFGV